MAQTPDEPPAKSMRSTWIDPEQPFSSSRRSPRTVNGFRRHDVLRMAVARRGSNITAKHIAAADKLRELVDVANLGFSSARTLVGLNHPAQPALGLNHAMLARNRAGRAVRRVMLLFTPHQIDLIEHIILRNYSIRRWAALDPTRSFNAERLKLFAVLDILASHFDAEITQEIASGRRLQPQED